jgi:hypothetical protein
MFWMVRGANAILALRCLPARWPTPSSPCAAAGSMANAILALHCRRLNGRLEDHREVRRAR